MKIELQDTIWVINDGEYTIEEGEETTYIVINCDDEIVYSNDDFEPCLVWIQNSI